MIEDKRSNSRGDSDVNRKMPLGYLKKSFSVMSVI